MQQQRATAAVAALVAAASAPVTVASLQRGSSTPVQKVLEMLANMKVKGAKDLQDEQSAYEGYVKFVRRQSLDLNLELEATKKSIDRLNAVIEKAENDAHEAATKISEINGQVDEFEATQKRATAMRDTDRALFEETQTSYQESEYAIDKALQVLSAENHDRPQAMLLLQRAVKEVRGLRKVLAMLQVEGDAMQPSAGGAPAVAGYESQGGSVIEMLEKLKDRFRADLNDLQKGEHNAAHSYEMSMLHTSDMLAGLKANREELAEFKAKSEVDAARATGSLKDAQASLAESQEFLADMKATFDAKTSTFKENQKVREEEITALQQGIEILSNPEVAGSYSKHINADLAQVTVPKPVNTLLQVRSASRRGQSKRLLDQERVVAYLKSRAGVLKSEVLASVAAQMQANPFAKVIDMIEGLLEKMQADATAEAEHKAYCDQELHDNKQKRKKYETEESRLAAAIEENALEIAGMAKDVKTLAAEEAALVTAMAEATAQRNKEKPLNEAAIKDAKAAQEAVQEATMVLKEWYEKQAFLQTGRKSASAQAPEMDEYQGMQGLGGGVLSMLEVIETDFSRLRGDTEAAEVAAVREYDRFMKEAEAAKRAKHEAGFKLGLKKDHEEFEMETNQKDRDRALDTLEMANKYYGELKPQCVTVDVSYEERVARRKEEIAALNEAYKLLDDKFP